MTLDGLVDLICKLRLDALRPVAIWFVDRPAEYFHLLRAVPGEYLEYLRYPLRIYGLDVHQFTNPGTKDEYARCPNFCRTSGIWVEMSDGNHVRLKEEKDEGRPGSESNRDGLAVEDSSRNDVDSSGTTT